MPNVWPKLSVLIVTYNRPNELRRTLESLADNLIYPNLELVIADDASPAYNEDYWKSLRLINHRIIRTPVNSGWGANANNALRNIHTPYIYMQEDDYVLTRTLDLRVGVAVMQSVGPDLNMIRYFGTGGDVGIVFDQFEADISAYLPEHRDGLGLPGKQTYLQIRPESDSLWLYSNRPHLKHGRFHGVYGLYPEGRRLGATEESYCHTVKDLMREYPDAPKIAVFPDWIAPRYDHIGQSYQLSEADKGARNVAS